MNPDLAAGRVIDFVVSRAHDREIRTQLRRGFEDALRHFLLVGRDNNVGPRPVAQVQPDIACPGLLQQRDVAPLVFTELYFVAFDPERFDRVVFFFAPFCLGFGRKKPGDIFDGPRRIHRGDKMLKVAYLAFEAFAFNMQMLGFLLRLFGQTEKMVADLMRRSERARQRDVNTAAVVIAQRKMRFVRTDFMQLRQHQIAQMPPALRRLRQCRLVVERFVRALKPPFLFFEQRMFLLFECFKTPGLFGFAHAVEVALHVIKRIRFGRIRRRRRRQKRLADPHDAARGLRIDMAQRFEYDSVFV